VQNENIFIKKLNGFFSCCQGFVEISEKVQKSLITLISNRLHRLEIRERKVVFQSSFMKPKAWLRLWELLDTPVFVRL
jgi:hypothetical protein